VAGIEVFDEPCLFEGFEEFEFDCGDGGTAVGEAAVVPAQIGVFDCNVASRVFIPIECSGLFLGPFVRMIVDAVYFLECFFTTKSLGAETLASSSFMRSISFDCSHSS
jgi:hypothetical protein